MIKHVLVRERSICEETFFVASVDETTRSAFRDINCPACLRQAIASSERRTQSIRELLATLEAEVRRCRVYDTACINPSYCDARDACCEGDPACTPVNRGEEQP